MNSALAHAGDLTVGAGPRSPGAHVATTRPDVLAVMTCFNRKAMTLACLEALAMAAERAGIDLQAVLVDDASPDGTADAVRSRFPWVEVLAGTGSLFWNRGMHMAFARAMQRRAGHYLWINDDTQLLPDALARLLAQSTELARRERAPIVLVGATAQPGSTQVSYGGRIPMSRLRPFKYRLVFSEQEAVPCHVIEGNCVLIPHEVTERVGNLDPAFEHAMGDTDYGLRALKAGCKLFVAKGIVGHCAANPLGGTYFDTSLPLATRWKLIRGRKGLPVRSWWRFCRRHGGSLWPLYFAWPYFKVVASGMRGVLMPRRAS